MAFTLLHTADIHLGKSFSSLPPERAGQRRADLLATLTRLCRNVRTRQVDLLCIAGDLFDRPASAPLLAATRAALADAGVPVVLVPGNHDPLEAGSPYLETAWPGNVFVAVQAGWQRIPIDDYEVWAFGYACGAAHRSPWTAFPGCGDDALLVLHAACLAPGLAVETGYYPFTPAEIPPCGYLALGHHHRAAQVSRTPVAWYAGSPEPLEPETTSSAVLQVRMERGTATVEQLDLATRHHRQVTLDVTGLPAEAIWDRALASAAVDDLLLLQLTGILEPSVPLDINALRSELSARCFAAELSTRELYLPEQPGGEGVMGTLQRLAQGKLADLSVDDPQRARLERALRYAAMALEGRL